ncbi:urease accessory protein UreE [Acidovorax sp. ACV01]|uniref:urease accessory protein UreE n=1 Tax=Acidovorax sp. ACV01 TaxID=2769311 RepID=UPI0017825D46|nr:urease accessory protein UreE [Acidovorax sp. ACV01]MBD9393306.1 urease accessory protein UreE [Acidovorax sp. ACV01]
MLQASKLLPQGQGLAPVLLKRATTIELDWDVRQKSRFAATDSAGRELGIFLPRGTLVRGGDVLVAEDGSMVRVIAAPQPVLVITHCTQHGTPFDLTRAAYHLGNRHVPIELQPDHLKIEPDHVLADMLRAMHLIVKAQDLPFEPEGGAYAAGHSGGHHHHGEHGHEGHGHDHDHAHGHDHDHDHGHSHAQAASPSPAHDHGHSHDHNHQADPSQPAAPARGRTVAIPVVAQAQGHVHGPHCNHGHDH